MTPRQRIIMLLLIIALPVAFIADIAIGSVSLSPSEVARALFGGDVDEVTRNIVVELRLCKAITAILVGIALSVSGLQMQTIFRNPLAGPFVLGISSGASLAVALMLLGGSALGLSISAISQPFTLAGVAWIGSALTLLLMLVLSRRMKDIMVVLILGIMISSGVSAVVQILQHAAADDSLKSFVVWTMGSLSSVTWQQLWLLLGATIAGLILAVVVIKPLNLLLLGEDYALTMGVNVIRSRLLTFASTTLLAGSVTAFCGPIGFIGLAMPHVARFALATANHRLLLPATALSGATVMLLCDIICKSWTLPLNSVTALMGIPIILWIVIKIK